MKKTSWEIIVAGLLLLLVAIFVTSKNEDNRHDYEHERAAASERTRTSTATSSASRSQSVTVINVEELAKLDELRELEELKSLEGLEKLKNLAALIPEEAKQEIMTELNAALRELEDDSFSINLDLNENLVFLKKEYKTTPGEWSGVSPGVYAYTKEFDASELKDVSVNLTGGSITLIGSDETKGSITVKASGQIKSKSELQEMVSISSINEGGNGEFRIINQRTKDSNIQLQTTIILPSKMGINSFTEGGHIDATNFQGDVELKTAGGHINLKDISGDITAYTEGGHIKLVDSKGDASLKSLGGHLTAKNFTGDLEMRTSGGNVMGTNLGGSTDAFSSGGNIKLQFISVGDVIQARNGAGQIEIVLPHDVSATLDVTGTKVEIDPVFGFKGERKKSQLKGKIGNGETKITAKTGYGTVVIKKNE